MILQGKLVQYYEVIVWKKVRGPLRRSSRENAGRENQPEFYLKNSQFDSALPRNCGHAALRRP